MCFIPHQIEASLQKHNASIVFQIKFDVIRSYIRAGGLIPCCIFVCFYLACLALIAFTQIWLSKWAEDSNTSTASKPGQQDYRLGMFGMLVGLNCLCLSLASTSLAVLMTNAARYFHSALFRRIMLAPMSFFDTTPLGRIVNRWVLYLC